MSDARKLFDDAMRNLSAEDVVDRVIETAPDPDKARKDYEELRVVRQKVMDALQEPVPMETLMGALVSIVYEAGLHCEACRRTAIETMKIAVNELGRKKL